MKRVGKKVLLRGVLLIAMLILAIPAAVSATEYSDSRADLSSLKQGDTLRPGITEIAIPDGWKLKLAGGGYCTQREDEDNDDDEGNPIIITERRGDDYIVTGRPVKADPDGEKVVDAGDEDHGEDVCIRDNGNTFYPYKDGVGKTTTWVVASVVTDNDGVSRTVTITGDTDAPPAKDEYSYYDEHMNLKRHKAETDFGAGLESGWYFLAMNKSFDNRMEIRGDVHLILQDGRTLRANDGIRVVEGCSLHIYGQKESSGKLIATSGNDAAGIGGNKNIAGGDIYIYGGTIEAKGGSGAAGIGGGQNRDGGRIFIAGGHIKADGGSGGAGIGGGRGGSGGQIQITQYEHYGYIPRYTNITATGGKGGAGIGGGQSYNGGGSGGSISIDSGYEKCMGGAGAAGIGGGQGGAAGTININDGTIDPSGRAGGAGIGSGNEGGGGSISIGGSWIHIAMGDGGGAGIGSGMNGQPVDIAIKGGEIYAQGSAASYGWGNIGQLPSAAIGGGANSKAGKITITGGKINASAATDGACVIGHGDGLSASTYTDTAEFTFNFPGSAVKARSGDGDWVSVPLKERPQVIFSRSTGRSGYLKGRAALSISKCDHAKAPMRSDDTGHYKMAEDCDECDATGKTDFEGHVLLTERVTAEGHIRKCVRCGYLTKEEKHTRGDTWCHVCNGLTTSFSFKADDSKNAVVKEGPVRTKDYDYALPGPEEVGIAVPESKAFAGWKYQYGKTYFTRKGDKYESVFPDNEVLTACWTIPWSSIADKMEQGGVVKLEDDVICGPEEAPLRVPAGKEATLDLNGHTIQKMGKGALEEGHCITVEGSLILTDTSKDKKGEIKGCVSESARKLIAGCVLVNPGGTFTMEAGTLRGNKAGGIYGGGAVTVDGGSFLMKGGRITDNKGSRASAVYARGGARVNLVGGEISGNSVSGSEGTDASWDRGAVYMENGKTKATRPRLILSGSPKVTGNRDEADRSCNVRMADQTVMEFDLKGSSEKLENSARIGVHFAKPVSGKIAITEGFRGSMGSFFSDDPALGIGIRTMDRELILGNETATLSFSTRTAQAQEAMAAAGAQEDVTTAGAQEDVTTTGAQEDVTTAQAREAMAASGAQEAVAAAGARKGSVKGSMEPMAEGIYDTVTAVAGESYILPLCSIEPPQGQVFDCWLIGGREYDPDGEEASVEIKEDTLIEPKWRPADPGQRRVIVLSDENGMAVADRVEQYKGQPVNILAVPEYGYQLAEFTVEKGNVKLEDETSEWTGFVMGSQEVVIRAHFEPIRVEELEISSCPASMKEGESFTLEAEVRPLCALDIDISFETTDPDIVKLSFNKYGEPVARALKAGTARILITTEKGQGPGKELKIEVKHKKLKHVKAKAYTVKKAGNIEYWKCETCGRYYADKEARKEITKKDTVLKCPKEEKTLYQLDAFYGKCDKAAAKKIRLRSVSAGKSKAGKGKAVVKWKKTSGVSSYLLVYSTDKKFRKAVKTKKVKAGKGKATLKGLKKGKRYYVKVYPCTKVKNAVNDRTYKIYGKGSKKKAVRIR